MKSMVEVVQNLLKPYIDSQIQTLTNQISASTDAYNASINYHVGDYCIYNNTLKRCIQDCTPASWDVNQSCFTDDTIVGALYDINNYLRDVTNTLISTNHLTGRIVYFNKLHIAELEVEATGLTSGSTSWETVSTNSDVIKQPLVYVRGKATVGEFRMNNAEGGFALQVNLRGEAVTDTLIHCTYIYK